MVVIVVAEGRGAASQQAFGSPRQVGDSLGARPERKDLVEGPREVVATVAVDSLEES